MTVPQALADFDFESLELDNEFWQFSLRAWKNEGLQKSLLECQNSRALKVNRILFSFWLSENGVRGAQLELDDLVLDTWDKTILSPLRVIRQMLPKQAVLSDMRNGIQSRELEAEQIEQALLYRIAKSFSETNRTGLSRTADKEACLDTLLNNLILSGVNDRELLLLLCEQFVHVSHITLPSRQVLIDRIAGLVT